MRINQKKSSKKKYIIVTIFLVLTIGGIIGYFIWYLPNQGQDNNATDNSTEEDSVIYTDNAVQNTNSRETDKDMIQNDSNNIDQNNLTGYITAKNIIDGKLQIRVQIDQYLTSGTCNIVIGSYSEQANIVTNPSSSTCQGWDIPTSYLQKGTQSIKIDIKSGNNSLTLTDEVNL